MDAWLQEDNESFDEDREINEMFRDAYTVYQTIDDFDYQKLYRQ